MDKHIERLRSLSLGQSYELGVTSTDTSEFAQGMSVADAIISPPRVEEWKRAQELYAALRNVANNILTPHGIEVEERIVRVYSGGLCASFKRMDTRHSLVFRRAGP